MRPHADVALPGARGLAWAARLVGGAWMPLGISVAGRWVSAVVGVLSSSCIAYVVARQGSEQGTALPAAMSAWLDGQSSPAIAALLVALSATVLATGIEVVVAWSGPWVHLILNRRLTPRALEAGIAPGERGMDAPTVVQRWLCKSDLVFLLNENIAAPLGHAGSILIAIAATFRADVRAGEVATAALVVWAGLAWLLTRRALVASRRAARAHEHVGRLMRDAVALRDDLSRPSHARRWLAATGADVDELQGAIREQGAWNTVLGGALDLVARGLPLVAVIAAVGTGGLGAAVAVLLYLAKLSGPLQALAGILPWLQQNLISIQRVFGMVESLRPAADSTPAFPLTRGLEARGWRLDLPDGPVELPPVRVQRGEVVCLVGPSGAGKSTYLGSLAGVRERAAGELLLDGATIDPTDPRWMETRAFLPQEPELIPGPLGENLDGGAGWRSAPARDGAVAALYRVLRPNTPCCVSADGAGASTGQRRAVALLRSLGGDAEILILDEPVAGIDDTLAVLLGDAITEAAAEGRVVVMCAHVHDLERMKLADVRVLRVGA